MDGYHEAKPLPGAFIWRRLQSLMGLWLVLFLIEHLLTNSQAALPPSDDGIGFIRAVNFIKNLPYLHVIEITLLAIPFLIHMIWGVKYLFTSKQNSYSSHQASPHLSRYPRNHAYTWQRITSWILLILVIGHVVHMRFINYPVEVKRGIEASYMVRVDSDPGIYTLADRLGVQIFDSKQGQKKKEELMNPKIQVVNEEGSKSFFNSLTSAFTQKDGIEVADEVKQRLHVQRMQENQEWVRAFDSFSLDKGQVVAVAPNFGIATLLMVRETFMMPIMLVLYSLLVLAATFHGFNGLWTFCITWGINLTARSQRNMQIVSIFLMILVGFLGLAAIWGTYFINLNS